MFRRKKKEETNQRSSQGPAWPRVNDQVILELELGSENARVEDNRDGKLLVARPAGDFHPQPEKTVVGVRWAQRSGVYQGRFVFLGERDTSPPVWVLRPLDEAMRVDRRAAFRVPLTARSGIQHQGEWSSASIVDLSESGILLALDSRSTPPNPDEPVTVDLSVVEEGLLPTGTVVRTSPRTDGRTAVAIQFDELGEEADQVLRYFLFQQQIKRKQK